MGWKCKLGIDKKIKNMTCVCIIFLTLKRKQLILMLKSVCVCKNLVYTLDLPILNIFLYDSLLLKVTKY